MTIDMIHAATVAQQAELVATRRDMHQHPEVAFEETRTADIIAQKLRALGIEVRTGVGKTGVVGVLRGGAATPTSRTIMVRADIDALPVQEANDVPYRSLKPGKMHACGHDGHIAIGLAVAAVLTDQRATLPGNVILLFQPAEERASGAQDMIADGALRDPQPDATVGLHLWSPFAVGTVGVKSGPIFASADEIVLRVHGRGGHGAIPQTSVDPIVAAAAIISGLQTLISREIAPTQPAVVTIGSIHGGTAFNIIADEVELRGTVRTYDPAVREHLLRRIPELANTIAQGFRATCDYASDIGIPSCVNDPQMTAIVQRAAEETVGAENVIADCMQTVGDDMSYFLQAMPGCYFLVGVGNAERGITAPHHSAHFDIDEGGLPIGTEILVRAVLDYLAPSN